MSGITDDGIEVPTTSEYVNTVRTLYESSLRRIEDNPGLTIDFDADTFLGLITYIVGYLLGLLGEALLAVFEAGNPANATGVHLDDFVSLFGITRKPDTYSTVTLLATGTPGTAINAGREASGGGTDGKARWVVQEDAVIGADGTVELVARAKVTGPTLAPQSQIATIATPVEGWDTVTNEVAAFPGRYREVDSALWVRHRESLQLGGGQAINAIRARLLNLDFIDSCSVIENATSVAQTVQGLAMTPNSIGVVLTPSALTTAQANEVAATIFALRPDGIEPVGSVVTTVTSLDGNAKTIRFSYASPLSIVVGALIKPKPGYSYASVQAEVGTVLESYFAALSVGQAVRLTGNGSLYGALDDVQGLQSCTLTLNGGSVDIEPLITEYAVLFAYQPTAA